MQSVVMGMPSNGTSGMNFQAKGKEYRNYQQQP